MLQFLLKSKLLLLLPRNMDISNRKFRDRYEMYDSAMLGAEWVYLVHKIDHLPPQRGRIFFSCKVHEINASA